jgi:signal transduction histidine kinase
MSTPQTPLDYPRELTMYGSIPRTGRVHVLWSVSVAVFLWALGWAQGLPGADNSLMVKLVYTLCLGYWGWTLIGIVWLGEVRRRWLVLPDAAERYQREGVYGLLRPSTVVWVTVLGVPVACVLGVFTAHMMLTWLPDRWAPAQELSLPVCLVLSYSLALGTFTVDWLRVHLAANEVRAEAAQRQALQAQLQLLHAQLEPHMLFNTLANLHALIDADPARAQDMLTRLIAFLRATLSASQRTTHPLSEEFSRAGDYLALMQVRMGARLQVELELPAGLSDVQVPPLLVQPLLENAIQHGLEPTRRGGLLSLHACQSGDQLWITVQDTGQGLREAAAHQAQAEAGTAARKGGYGLTHVRERLMSLYGGRASLVLMPAEEGPGTVARLALPLYHSPVWPSAQTDAAPDSKPLSGASDSPATAA